MGGALEAAGDNIMSPAAAAASASSAAPNATELNGAEPSWLPWSPSPSLFSSQFRLEEAELKPPNWAEEQPAPPAARARERQFEYRAIQNQSAIEAQAADVT